MSLIKCSECQKEISDKEVACPSCGNPTKQNSTAEKDVEILINQINTVRKSKWKIMKAFFGI